MESKWVLHQGIDECTIRMDVETGRCWVLIKSLRPVNGVTEPLLWWREVTSTKQQAIDEARETSKVVAD